MINDHKAADGSQPVSPKRITDNTDAYKQGDIGNRLAMFVFVVVVLMCYMRYLMLSAAERRKIE